MLHEELRALFPNIPDEEFARAKENLDQYLLLAWEIMEEQKEREASLTQNADDHSIEAKVDSPNPRNSNF